MKKKKKKTIGITQYKEQKEKIKKNEQIQETYETLSNVPTYTLQDSQKEEKEAEKISEEIMDRNFWNLRCEYARPMPNRINRGPHWNKLESSCQNPKTETILKAATKEWLLKYSEMRGY